MQDSSGTVGPTAQEQQLSANANAEFARYSSKWLPLQDHLSDVVTSMGQPDSWQRQEAEGKGNTDVAQQFAQIAQNRTASTLDHGINVGSSAYKLGVAASATAEAEAKGAAVNNGNQQIDKAYLSGLTSITKAGESLAGTAMGGAALGGEVSSREAITGAQLSNENRANNWNMIGTGIGMLAASYGQGIGGVSDQATVMANADQDATAGANAMNSQMMSNMNSGINMDTSAMTQMPSITY